MSQTSTETKTTTKVPSPFVVEMTFAQIKPAMLWQHSEPVPSAPGRPERGATRTLVRERRLEGRDGVLGAGAASSLKGGYQGVLPNEDSMASWRLSSRRMVCELSQAACQPRAG